MFKNKRMKLAIGNDHAGTDYKFEIVDYLKQNGIEVQNFGTDDNQKYGLSGYDSSCCRSC